VITFLRRHPDGHAIVLVACNFTPIVRDDYWVGVPLPGLWEEVLNGDAVEYGGSGVGNLGGVATAEEAFHGRPFLLRITLPPLATVFFRLRETA
jgi:1,4-alpha-glucan branching enzyme